MKSIIIFLALIFTVNISAQINLLYKSSSAFYISESYKSTKQLSFEVATNILFELRKDKKMQNITFNSFVLTNERDNTYTGNLVLNDNDILVTFPVEVVYDGSSVRWTIPPMLEWSLAPKKKVLTEAEQKSKLETDKKTKNEADADAKKKKLDALLAGISKNENNSYKEQHNDDPYLPLNYSDQSTRNEGIGINGRGIPTKKLIRPDCNESGLVVVKIVVNRNGDVIEAIPGIKGTTNMNNCLLETAKKIALSHKWQADNNAPDKQFGFVAINFTLK